MDTVQKRYSRRIKASWHLKSRIMPWQTNIYTKYTPGDRRAAFCCGFAGGAVIIQAMEDWLTTYEAARISEYELDYIRKLIRAKKILGRKWGQSWQVNRLSLMEFIEEREKQGEKRGRKPVHREQ